MSTDLAFDAIKALAERGPSMTPEALQDLADIAGLLRDWALRQKEENETRSN